MHIEIITAKKKLTKSILKQMEELPYPLFEQARVLGWIRCVYRQGDKYLLCKAENNYYIINSSWSVCDRGACHFTSKGTMSKSINDLVKEDWFKQYDKLLEDMKNTEQIYI